MWGLVRQAVLLGVALPLVAVVVLWRRTLTCLRTHTHTRSLLHWLPCAPRSCKRRRQRHADVLRSPSRASGGFFGPAAVSRDAERHLRYVCESACEIAHAIRQGTVTSEEIVRLHIRQAQRVNHCLNAITERRFEDALEEARRADARVRAHTQGGAPDLLPPFLGVPCTIKEVFAVTGMRQTAGVLSRAHIRAQSDATVVARLREKGFIPIATTNVSELCMWYESDNLLYGTTRNAYDHERMVGGSSGGEGALVSACGAPVGIGSDIGGSIRMPAAFNGIFGHKPTGGLIPNSGQYPSTPHPILTSGPLVRRAEDLWPAVLAIIGPDHVDPACRVIPCVDVDPSMTYAGKRAAVYDAGPWAAPAPAPSPVAGSASPPRRRSNTAGSEWPWALRAPCRVISTWRSVTVHTLPDIDAVSPRFSTRVEDSIRAAIGVAATTMVDTYGCQGVTPFHLPEMRDAFDIWAAVLHSNGPPTFADLMHQSYGGKLDVAAELLRWCFGASRSTLPALILTIIEPLPALLLPTHVARLSKLAVELRRRVADELASRSGVLLVPVHPTVAPHHEVPYLRPFNVGWTQMFNVLELPSTTVPMGLDADGMPVAIQVVGAPGYDRLTIAVAEALERAGVAGWMPPPIADCPSCEMLRSK